MDDILARVVIASPCSTSWEAMKGDDRIRACDLCERRVYNLSALTSTEANDLIARSEGRICARLYRRKDGTVLTADCPEGRRRLLGRRLRRLVTGGILTAALAQVGAALAPRMAGAGYRPSSLSTPSRTLSRMIGRFPRWLGIASFPQVMGKICVAPPPTSNGLLLGKVTVEPGPAARVDSPVDELTDHPDDPEALGR